MPVYEAAAKVIANNIKTALSIEVCLSVMPVNEMTNWALAIAEKKRIPDFDILLTDVFALFTQEIPVFVHRELFGKDGKFRVGPEIEHFNKLYESFAKEVDEEKRMELAKDVDRYVNKEALGIFLCSPNDLYAVNHHVYFRGYRSTFELVDTEVSELHWSRRDYV